MKIRTKLSGVVWTLVSMTFVLSVLFAWGGLRFQYYLQRIQLAHEQHHALLSLSENLDHFFAIVYESVMRPGASPQEEFQEAHERIRSSFASVLNYVDAEIALADEDERDRERTDRAHILDLQQRWESLKEETLAEIARTRSAGDWTRAEADRILTRALRFSSLIGVLRGQYDKTRENAAEMQMLFQRLALTGILAWGSCSVLLGAFLWLLRRSILRPIQKLLRGSAAFGRGELAYRVETGGENEFSELAESFNTMAARVESQRVRLLDAKRTVEEKNVSLESEAEARRKALKDLRVAKEAAESASRAKSDFLAKMSHEIRTPMNGIIGTAEVMAKHDLGEELNEYIRTIRNSGQALLAIVNDVLDFSKIEAGVLQLAHEPFDLRELVRDVVRLLEPRAAEKGLQIDVDYASNTTTAFVGDGGRLRQILVNLVGNAVKFTGEGRVSIRVDCEEQAARAARIRVTVEDTGIGVSEEQLERIFEEFSQADHPASARFEGTGLGLSITRGLVERMGGTIGVESTPGEGSTFWFSLDLQTDEAAGGARTPAASDESELPSYPMRVLVVDDNQANRRVAQRMLETFGCTVVTAASGEESVERVRSVAWDLIFMDCRMPGMDGFQAMTAIRELESESDRRVPIVAVTANALKGDREKCLEAGMDDYVAKPISMADFRAVLERWRPAEPESDVPEVETGAGERVAD